MDNIPRIRIELDGVRQTVQHMFGQSSDEFKQLILDEIEKQLTTEFIQAEIARAVSGCLKSAIYDMTNNYNLKCAITSELSDAVVKVINNE